MYLTLMRLTCGPLRSLKNLIDLRLVGGEGLVAGVTGILHRGNYPYSMKKILGLVISLFLLGSLLAPSAYASVKQGGKCTVQGQSKNWKGKKFTCINSGRKLIWNQGVKVTKPKSTSRPLPNLTPEPVPSNSAAAKPNATNRIYPAWGAPISELEISRTSRINFKSWLASQSVGVGNIKISINPNIDPKRVEYLTSVLKITSRTLLQNQNKTSHFYISIGDSWAISQMKKDFPTLAGWSGVNACYEPNPYAACAWPSHGIVFFISQSSLEWNNPNQGIVQTAAHEYFHLVQDVLLRNSLGLDPGTLARKIPAWFFEGSASFVGTAYADESGLASWDDMRNDEISAYAIGRGTNQPLSSFKDNVVDRPQPEGQSLRPYGIGMLASEFIVASVGMEKFLDVFTQLSTGKPFSEAFSSATGLNLEDFYSKFDSMRTQIGFYPVK
jgi:hypothetical protein